MVDFCAETVKDPTKSIKEEPRNLRILILFFILKVLSRVYNELLFVSYYEQNVLTKIKKT
jgi:hypothetical protein